MNTKVEIGLFVLTAIFALIYAVWMINTEKRLKRFFAGKKGKDLEESIEILLKKIEMLERAKESAEKELETINVKLRKSIRGLGTLRFNPFPDQGSNQSFAIGMMNEDGDGVVLSSLYARDRMSIFAKPVKNNKSEYELTEEEKEALKKAEVK
ncbi:hypothetical protein A3D42_03335 [Candidatus Nomurabacteria bacterium RIFCSPHIGHO2_02_FULL_41_18]|uniref:DUF4446 domain-containing protein n=1 Tax=Candidatus Nomurabacteria bacterium RIFCSPHIGHO2_02_FULL_41_18 TaxID=1801754 RepID=A0A1F6W7L5_9BACT|nr:MAG: hypothetical protein A2737_00165 [Candidatus Nomurabacteria bacterium RIFCSPHIGHO2_01_FULL_41_71]OGI77918.1 MAG: hypothetical protein A3D42_03335 [Candidatus Nomurabacteria bacterium RIFCSPHIGHO2_02_FULL_41_18]OGI90333.1 MAG: hypothetical protein A3B01_01250 [Candidatus Nomurabacteria bacterium RIFCSPLOWO2_01_FULL_41_52b]